MLDLPAKIQHPSLVFSLLSQESMYPPAILYPRHARHIRAYHRSPFITIISLSLSLSLSLDLSLDLSLYLSVFFFSLGLALLLFLFSATPVTTGF
jgi:hypothetical protein